MGSYTGASTRIVSSGVKEALTQLKRFNEKIVRRRGDEIPYCSYARTVLHESADRSKSVLDSGNPSFIKNRKT